MIALPHLKQVARQQLGGAGTENAEPLRGRSTD
jgi:hypothetical protein